LEQSSVKIGRGPTGNIRTTIFYFGFAFCDTQSGGFSMASTVICGSKPASNFVIYRNCEIANHRLTVLADAGLANTGHSQHSCRAG
jgi:hypothetical protein